MFHSEYADVTPLETPIHEAVLGNAADFGDTPALIDGTDGTTVTYGRLYVADRVSPYEKVGRAEFIEAVPRAVSGRILRRELRDREEPR